MPKILVLNGPNRDLLASRHPGADASRNLSSER
jgi:3-dehydroquinate dehydratase